MAQDWLDLARYADSDGYEKDRPRPFAWQYRDWVIKAFNDDLPFDQFVIEQLAGDMLPNATLQQRIATGFHRNTQINTEGGVDKEQFRIDSIFDRIATTGEVMFGLTLGCAQCHDHKFDPISQLEYYRLFAFFNNADEPRIEAPTADVMARRVQHDIRVKQLEAGVKGLGKEDAKRKPLEANLAKLKKARPAAATTLVMARRGKPRTTHRFVEGDFTRPAEVMQPGTPSVLHRLAKANGDRLGFARWVADRNNPLLARVAVNRMWQHFFGRGIVEPVDDMNLANPPSNAPLLDYLANGFVENGYDMKWLHRTILNSDTYQRSWRPNETNRGDERNFSRMVVRRLPAEVVADAITQATASNTRVTAMSRRPINRTIGPATSGRNNRNSKSLNYALSVFGKPDRTENCDCERSSDPTLLQAVFPRNDPTLISMINGDDRKAKGWIAEIEEWYSGKTKSANQTKGDKRLKQLIGQRKKLQSKPPKKTPNANNPTAALQYQAAQKNHRQALQRLNQAIRKLGGNATNGRLAKRGKVWRSNDDHASHPWPVCLCLGSGGVVLCAGPPACPPDAT